MQRNVEAWALALALAAASVAVGACSQEANTSNHSNPNTTAAPAALSSKPDSATATPRLAPVGNPARLDSTAAIGPTSAALQNAAPRPTPTTPHGTAPGPTETPTAQPDPGIEFQPDKLLRTGGTRFVSLDNPETVKAGEATYLSPNELVMGITQNGASRAYPLQMAQYHHIFNDELGGKPLAVTY